MWRPQIHCNMNNSLIQQSFYLNISMSRVEIPPSPPCQERLVHISATKSVSKTLAPVLGSTLVKLQKTGAQVFETLLAAEILANLFGQGGVFCSVTY